MCVQVGCAKTTCISCNLFGQVYTNSTKQWTQSTKRELSAAAFVPSVSYCCVKSRLCSSLSRQQHDVHVRAVKKPPRAVNGTLLWFFNNFRLSCPHSTSAEGGSQTSHMYPTLKWQHKSITPWSWRFIQRNITQIRAHILYHSCCACAWPPKSKWAWVLLLPP